MHGTYFLIKYLMEANRNDLIYEVTNRKDYPGWGYMLANGPRTTMWETIAPFGGGPLGGSWDHGWSSGAAPALTSYVLGVQPTSPGYATFTVTPHPTDLSYARGTVPTPHGDITVSWTYARGKLSLSVDAPAGERWTNPPPRVVRK